MSDEVTMSEIGRTVIRLEQKLDRSLDDHELRLRALERWMWGAMAAGGVGAASGLGAFLTGLLG